MRRRFVGISLSLVLVLAFAAPASAIVYGQRDDGDPPRYPNVGAIIIEFEGQLFNGCTGTLIARDLVLTAAHCVFGEEMGITFVANLEEMTPADIHWGTPYPHESFACCGANDTYDIAVIRLYENVAGVPIAPIASPNQLGTMSAKALKSAVFTTAGYGAVRDTRKTAWQALYSDPFRQYATQTANSLTKAWLTLSMNQATGNGGTCYGDSGGPHFLGSTVVSITVTGDRWCKSTDKTYRIDTPVAQEFLHRFLP